jgi:hypothetical protein
MVHVQLCILLYGVSGVHGDEVSGLGESIHNYPMESFFLGVKGKPTMKSILISSHFHIGIDRGWSTPADFK